MQISPGLFNSRVATYREILSTNKGIADVSYQLVIGMERVPCRLDVIFLRPGKDIPEPIQAGKAPDRVGILFASVEAGFRAGDVITVVPNDFGKLPVSGTFQIKVIPDIAQDFSSAHHVEIQIVENAQPVDDFTRPWPGGE